MPRKASGKFDQNKYGQEYHAKYYTARNLKFKKDEDADVLAKLDSVPSKTDYVRQLIRADIKKSGEH